MQNIKPLAASVGVLGVYVSLSGCHTPRATGFGGQPVLKNLPDLRARSDQRTHVRTNTRALDEFGDLRTIHMFLLLPVSFAH